MPTRRAVIAGALGAPALLPRLARAQADTRPVLRIAVQALPSTLEPLETISNVYFAKRRTIRWTHHPLYYMDFRSYNLGFA